MRQNSASDHALLCSLIVGDLSLAALYDRNGSCSYALALKITNDVHSSEEIVRAVFLQLWRNALRLVAAHVSVLGFLLTDTRSRAIRQMRFPDREYIEPPNHGMVPGSRDIRSGLEAQPFRNLMLTALADLTESQLTALELSYFSGRNCKEMAVQVNKSEEEVKSTLRVALKRMSEAFVKPSTRIRRLDNRRVPRSQRLRSSQLVCAQSGEDS